MIRTHRMHSLGWPAGLLMRECDDLETAQEKLATLPLVRKGLIHFEIIGLTPYPGWGRLFSNRPCVQLQQTV